MLFNETKYTISLHQLPTKVISGDRIIIKGNLSFSNKIPTLLHYFFYVAQVFTKYRLSFKLSKCDFFKDKVVYIGHDFTADEKFPAVFKFLLLQDWYLFHLMLHLSCHSSGYTTFTLLIDAGLKLTSNRYGSCNEYIIVRILL